jgi:muramoyltetrapeptide carboxypeptidase LdcA involved in peptidoglycan recycling
MHIPPKLVQGDRIAVIAPAKSFSVLSKNSIEIANKRFKEMGLEVVFGKHTQEIDLFDSSSIKNRIDDLHSAFQDPSIKAILTVIGGFNSNQLLKYIHWDLIKNNPKIFCGYSDITVLQNAMLTKAGLVTYSGPHYSSFGQLLNFEYTFDYFKKCLFSAENFEIKASPVWSDDAWYLNQQDCNLIENYGPYSIVEGEASGVIVGGNLTTLQNLKGTEYFPSLRNSILFLEDDYESSPHHVDRNLQSLLFLEDFKHVRGIVFGRFQKQSTMTKHSLQKIIETKKELQSIPIIADVDFGHTSPMITFPIGGEILIKASNNETKIIVTKH